LFVGGSWVGAALITSDMFITAYSFDKSDHHLSE
jgi:hypothetical protein